MKKCVLRNSIIYWVQIEDYDKKIWAFETGICKASLKKWPRKKGGVRGVVVMLLFATVMFRYWQICVFDLLQEKAVAINPLQDDDDMLNIHGLGLRPRDCSIKSSIGFQSGNYLNILHRRPLITDRFAFMCSVVMQSTKSYYPTVFAIDFEGLEKAAKVKHFGKLFFKYYGSTFLHQLLVEGTLLSKKIIAQNIAVQIISKIT